MGMRSQNLPDLRKFNFLIENLSEDKIGHLFIVDIKFDIENANEKLCPSMKFICQFLKNKNYNRI